MSTRLSVNVSDETAATLRLLAATHETSITDIIRRAVAVYELVDRETRSGKSFQFANEKDGIVKEITLLP